MSKSPAWQFRFWVGVFTVLVLACYGVSVAGAETIYVDDDAPNDPGPGDPTVSDPNEDGTAAHPFDAIQEGIDVAVGGDTVLVADGTYMGEGNKDLDFGGKAITLRSESEPENCVIDCDQDGRAFFFHSGETAEAAVIGFTIWDAEVDDDYDGAILCNGASPTIRDCEVAHSSGLGVYVGSGSPRITNCTIINNRGGGIRGRYADLVISQCHITGNFIGGGVICYRSDVAISISQITANAGGGVYFSHGHLTLSNCEVSHNLPGGAYGSIAGVQMSHSDATINNCTIAENLGGRKGAGLSAYRSTLTIYNCAITANNATLSGGGVYVGGNSDAVIANSTIAGNTALLGGGVACDGGEAILLNSVLWHNTAMFGPQLVATDWLEYIGALSVSHCDVEGGEANVRLDGDAMLTWGPANIDADPLFVAPDTGDYHLLPGSPCIDAGCNWAVPRDIADLDDDGDTDEITPLDLDGEGRFFDDPETPDTGCGWPPIVDMGAYEFGNTGPQPCFGDLDNDRDVDLDDLAVLLIRYGESDACEGDLDCDGDVDLSDLAALLAAYGMSCE